ncbi:TIGR03986 family CRISPR-associated RAMP protein [Dehalococcoidia bacterium]|nr:TIGR03986 family CRISPR-associated RAMP protein [Dehalococcoidia bacterium]
MPDFVYPFNFVPPADQLPRRAEKPTQEKRTGGYRPFQSLHRYQGKTGRIEFTLKNLSPLFVPDSEGTNYYHIADEKGKPKYDKKGNPHIHRVMDFFNVKGDGIFENGRLAIPSTSLKGMIRGVAEALSNSSFGVFTPQEKKFKFRKVKDLGGGVNDLRRRQWGRWQADGTIEPLETAKIWREDFDNALGLTTDAQRIEQYNFLRENQTVVDAELWQLHTGNPHVRAIITGTYSATVFGSTPTPIRNNGQLQERAGFKSEVVCGTQHYSGPILQMLRNALGLGRGRGPWDVEEFQTIARVPNGEPSSDEREERVCYIRAYGRVWHANQGIKKVTLWPRRGWEDMELSERANSHYIAALYSTGRRLSVPDDAKRDYRDANQGVLPNPNDIVRYYEADRKVVEFGPVAMFKTPEQSTVREIAEQTHHLMPRKANNKLCPASRLFGWTPEDDSQQGEEKFPVAGRVRVGVAWSDKTLNDTRLLPLQILGSPKPEYYPFYLRPQDRDKASTHPAYYATPDQADGWWHTPGLLRGRKFYLHHPDAVNENPTVACNSIQITPEMVSEEIAKKQRSGEQIRAEDLRSYQNATAAVLPPGAEFKGYVEFDSLSDDELGLLLWAISLTDSPQEGRDERAHKLGMGRPTGMGSVRLKIDSIVTFDPVGGWRDANEPGDQEMTSEEAARLVKAFKTWMVTGKEMHDDTQVSMFDNQSFYKDLCDVLNLDLAGGDPVQYYRPGKVAYEGFNYFAEQRQNRNRAKEQPLHTPSELRNGERQR